MRLRERPVERNLPSLLEQLSDGDQAALIGGNDCMVARSCCASESGRPM